VLGSGSVEDAPLAAWNAPAGRSLATPDAVLGIPNVPGGTFAVMNTAPDLPTSEALKLVVVLTVALVSDIPPEATTKNGTLRLAGGVTVVPTFKLR